MGEGAFGNVFGGDFTTDSCVTRPVIIRFLSQEANTKIKQDFQREVSTENHAWTQ